jgi:hypothetical protein
MTHAKIRRIEDCFPELVGKYFAGFSARLLADFLYRELRPASYCNFVILFVQTSEKIEKLLPIL